MTGPWAAAVPHAGAAHTWRPGPRGADLGRDRARTRWRADGAVPTGRRADGGARASGCCGTSESEIDAFERARTPAVPPPNAASENPLTDERSLSPFPRSCRRAGRRVAKKTDGFTPSHARA